MMRLVILFDGTVGKDGLFFSGLDLSGCGLPANFWALQWNEHGDNRGHVEYNDTLIGNTDITEVPAWANACVVVWNAALAEAQAATQSHDA